VRTKPRRAGTSRRPCSRRAATLAQAYFNYLISVLRLKAAAGTLSELDLEDINRRLGG